jgi:RNA recognition motif-containing protein
MNIFVGNLNPTTVSDQLKVLFEEFGAVSTAKIIMDSATGTSRGFGFVEMLDYNASVNAIDNLDMSYFDGNIISVKEAKQSNTGGRGGAPGNRPNNRPRPNSRPNTYNKPGGGGRSEGNYNRTDNRYDNNRPNSYSKPNYERNYNQESKPDQETPSDSFNSFNSFPKKNDDLDIENFSGRY